MSNDKTMNTYKRMGLVLVRGSGSTVEDEDGKKYIDFTSGIGVNSLGHAHPKLVAAIAEQAGKIIHTCNYYQSRESIELSDSLCTRTGMDAVFFCNSGAEANEGAIKIARKCGEARRASTIVTLRGSFHGRTIATLAATGQDKFHEHFGPFPAGFVYVDAEDKAALDTALDKSVCALMLEPIQGESGVIPLSEGYLRYAASLCAERGILLIADEVQCGVGRTGSFLASSPAGIRPDIVTLAKGLAGGVPVGAVLARGEAATILKPGDHGTTFGGNPLAAAAGRVVLAELGSPGFLEGVAKKGERILETVRSWKHLAVKEVRGAGLMIGIVVTVPPDKVKELCIKHGLLVLTAGSDVVRLLPPLVITDMEIDRGLAILKEVLDSVGR
jgi:acetylornithine/N-succinyldiaminopimelate aminotransferase